MISVADVVPTSLPTTDPTGYRVSVVQLSVFAGWTAVAVVLAISAGLFRRRTIVGPERMPVEEPGWQLIGIALFGYSAAWFVVITVLSKMAGSLPAVWGTIAVNGAFQATCLPIMVVLLLTSPGYGSVVREGLSVRRLPGGLMAGIVGWVVIYPVCALTMIATTAICARLHVFVPTHVVLTAMHESRSVAPVVVGVFVAAVVAPMNEELLFRGSIQTGVSRVIANWAHGPATLTGPVTRWSAVVLTAVVFAAIHLQVTAAPTIFVLALGVGYVYERTGNLWAAATVHMLFNLAGTVLSFWGG